MYEIEITTNFSAAHRLRDYNGKCERLHGHNWKVEVVAGAMELDPLGMVMDFRRLKEKVDRVLEALDHQVLNEVPPFTEVNPTAENIARHVFESLAGEVPVSRVNVFETDTSVASYYR